VADSPPIAQRRHFEAPGKPAPSTEGVAMLKKTVTLLIALSFIPGVALMSGCNTVQGAGQDISKAGQKVEKEAAEHKKY
jgi:predicted small secreted protein